MYCLQIGNGAIIGHVTAGDLWQDRNFQVRCRGIAPSEFQRRLNDGETLKYFASKAWLKGEPVYDDIDAYLEARQIPMMGYFPELSYECVNLESLTSFEEISFALDRAGVPNNGSERVRCMLRFIGARISDRFPVAYADKLSFEELARTIIGVNGRNKTIAEKRIPVYDELWRIAAMLDLAGNIIMDEERNSLLNREVSLLLVRRGMGLVLELATDGDERFINGATVLYIEHDDSRNLLTVTTRNTIFKFERGLSKSM